jgi:predicted GH43/DUF377 family glycosyl hydrolase
VPWQLGPFTRHPEPVIRELPALAWASKDVFNPGAVVHDGKVHLLVRGEDTVGRYAGTSRIGLAISDNGIDFVVEPEPVLAPGDDRWDPWEGAGGCEDPRVVESPDGGFVCLYTGFDGKVGTLMVATSDDLRTWTKHGPAFAGTPYTRRSSKSGAVVTEVRDGRLVAAAVDGRYWMYWGEGTCFAATSDDLVRWAPLDFDATGDHYLTYGGGSWAVNRVPGQRVLRPLLFPRTGRFDSLLVEPGPPALRTENGIVLIYNGANHPDRGDPSLPPYSYQPGQALFDPADPAACIARATAPFLRAETRDEHDGQVADVCFAQALVCFANQWRLYFGMADSRIGCATAPLS